MYSMAQPADDMKNDRRGCAFLYFGIDFLFQPAPPPPPPSVVAPKGVGTEEGVMSKQFLFWLKTPSRVIGAFDLILFVFYFYVFAHL